MSEERRDDVLPSGWARATLGDLGLYHNGRGFKKSEWRDAGRPIIRIQNLTDPTKPFNYFDGEADPRNEVDDGDILVSWAATLDAFKWRGPGAVLNQHIFKVESFISPEFHYYLLRSVLSDLRAQAHGSGMVHITRSRFLDTPVDVPPLAEQDRIVAAIEEQFSRIDDGQNSLHQAQRLVSALRQQTLDRLGEAQTGLDRPLADCLTQPLMNGRSVPTAEEGFPVLRLTALKRGFIDHREAKVGAWTEAEARRYLVQAGDFLVSRGNGSLKLVGRGGLVAADQPPVAFPDTLIRLRVNNEVLRQTYLRLIWDSRVVRRQIESQARTTAGIYKINQQMLRELRLPVPSIREQDAIVRRAHEQLAVLDELDAILERQVVSATQLRRSLLEQALSGRLVRQDPADEPASERLGGIRDERAANLQIEGAAL